jgi:hypothetical protein
LILKLNSTTRLGHTKILVGVKTSSTSSKHRQTLAQIFSTKILQLLRTTFISSFKKELKTFLTTFPLQFRIKLSKLPLDSPLSRLHLCAISASFFSVIPQSSFTLSCFTTTYVQVQLKIHYVKKPFYFFVFLRTMSFCSKQIEFLIKTNFLVSLADLWLCKEESSRKQGRFSLFFMLMINKVDYFSGLRLVIRRHSRVNAL